MPTALSLSRTITTLDDVRTWIRDVATFNNGWCLDPTESGSQIVNRETSSATFTEEEATAYDNVWAACWNVAHTLGIDLYDVLEEINPNPLGITFDSNN